MIELPPRPARLSDLHKVALARFISRMGGEAAFFIGIWGKAAYHLHATPGQLAAIMAVLAVAVIVGSAVAGMLVDRYGPRRVLAGAELAYVPTAIGMIWAGSLPALAVLVGLHGLVAAPAFTAVASIAPFMSDDPGELTRLNAWIEGATSLGFVIGPGIGALIVTYASLDWVFVLDAATSLLAVPLIWSVTLREKEVPAGEHRSPLAEVRDGLRLSYGSRGLRYTVLMGTAMWLGFGAFGALEPLFFRDAVGTGVATIGWVNTLFGLGMIAGAALLPRLPRRVVSARGLAIVGALMGLGAGAYVGTTDLRVIAAGCLAWGVVIGVADPLLRTLLQADSPDELVGRVAGTAQMHRQAGELLPLALAPGLAARFGVQRTLIGGGLVLTVLALASWFEASAVDRAGHLRDVAPSGAARDPLAP